MTNTTLKYGDVGGPIFLGDYVRTRAGSVDWKVQSFSEDRSTMLISSVQSGLMKVDFVSRYGAV